MVVPQATHLYVLYLYLLHMLSFALVYLLGVLCQQLNLLKKQSVVIIIIIIIRKAVYDLHMPLGLYGWP